MDHLGIILLGESQFFRGIQVFFAGQMLVRSTSRQDTASRALETALAFGVFIAVRSFHPVPGMVCLENLQVIHEI